jgi:outer membrane protein OmpA-like peptidoglycan-associated protein
MTPRVFVTIFTVLALQTFAQQTNQNSTAQPPVQNVGTTCTEPLQPAPSKDFWDGDEPNVSNLVGHAFNTKKDVQKQTKPIQNCLDELSDAAGSHTRMIKDMDSRTQQGLQLASTRVNEADQHAVDADSRAKAAHQAASQATTRVSTVEQVVGSGDQYKGNTETEIRFRPGQSVLSKAAKDALDQLAGPLKDQGNYVIEVRGFSPGRGQAGIADSQKMADSVARYLILNHQIPVHRIYARGMGNAPVASNDGTTARPSSGRVEVSVLKNNLAIAEQH